jgi:hypothetical protein
MTIAFRKPYPPLVSFEFRFSGFELEKDSKINPPTLCGDVLACKIFVCFASGALLNGLQKKLIETR